MNTTLSSTMVGLIGVIAVFVGLVIGVTSQNTPILSGVTAGNEYNATSTAPNTYAGATISGDKLIKTGSGGLGSVVVTGANTGIMYFYDATTTDVGKRTGSLATSTILIASLPASLVAGTYVFDASFSFGLLLELDSGTMPTTTVLYR